MKGEIQDIKITLETICKTIQANNAEEVKGLREEIRRKDEDWKRERIALQGKIESLENRIEFLQKDEKKLNIVIKCAGFKNTDIKKEVKEMVREKSELKWN